MRRSFSEAQEEFLERFIEALFIDCEMVITPRQVVDNLQTQFGQISGTKPLQIALLIDAVWLILGGPFFLTDSIETRAGKIRDRLQNTDIDLLQDFGRIRTIVYAGYYGHWEGVTQDDNAANPVHAQIGFTLPKFRDRSAPGELAITLFEGRELTHEAFVGHDAPMPEPDIIVIGSGAGGAIAARNLAAHGHSVLIVEAGPHYPSQRITHEERRMTARLFKDGAIQTSADNDFVVFQARCVGGGPVINNGICLRVDQPGLIHPDAQDVLDKWAAIGAPLNRTRFDASYQAVEDYLGIGAIDPKIGRNNGRNILDGWAKVKAASDDPMDATAPAAYFRKNWGPTSIGAECAYCGYCNTGCPYGRKHGMAQSYLIDAVAHGALILADAPVTEILWGEDRDGQRVATGVRLTLDDGRERVVHAKKGVVVAAGTMASSRILAASGIDGTGEGISLNIASPVSALMPADRAVRAWDEDQMTTYVDRGDYLLESHFQPPMSMATLLTGWFAEHARKMKNYNRLASAGILFPADRRGRVEGNGFEFKLDGEIDLPLIRKAVAKLARVHFANGAEEVYPALTRGGTLYPDTDIEAFLFERIKQADDIVMSSSHPHGGNAMNDDPSLGVVDTDCRVHGTANVMVTDASVFPSCIRVNAQLTTMAMAQYATATGGIF
jgi:choline dehydrogenase-like flavoprotein